MYESATKIIALMVLTGVVAMALGAGPVPLLVMIPTGLAVWVVAEALSD